MTRSGVKFHFLPTLRSLMVSRARHLGVLPFSHQCTQSKLMSRNSVSLFCTSSQTSLPTHDLQSCVLCLNPRADSIYRILYSKQKEKQPCSGPNTVGAGVLGIWAKKCKVYGQNMENKEPMGRVKGQRDMVTGHQSLVPSSSVWVWTDYAILWVFVDSLEKWGQQL